jgi:hypothetical protein
VEEFCHGFKGINGFLILDFYDGFDSKPLCKYMPKILGNVKD